MSDLNRIQIIGRLGQDPESRYTPSGKRVTKFSVATNRRWTSPDGKENTATDWFNVETWNGLAEVVDQYLRKGRKVFVEGRLQVERYEKDGQPCQYVKIVASNVIFLDSRGTADEIETPEMESVPF